MDEKYLYLENVAAAVAMTPDSIVNQTLHTDERSKVVVFAFDAGQKMAEHSAAVPIVIHILRGAAEVTVGDEVKIVTAGAWFWLEARVPHSIVATTPVVMLLTLFKTAT